MDFEGKISTILKTNKLQLVTREDLSEFCGFNKDTIRKAIERGSELGERYTRILQDKLSINTDWWDTGKGDIYLQNHAQMPKPTDNNENPSPDEVWSQVEKSEKYTVVPTIILTEYEILSKNEIESRKNLQEELIASQRMVIASKNDVITELRKEIDLLKSGNVIIPSQQTQKDLTLRNS